MFRRSRNMGVLPAPKLPIPAQISPKTVYLAVGLSVFFLLSSAAVLIWSRRRKAKGGKDVLPPKS